MNKFFIQAVIIYALFMCAINVSASLPPTRSKGGNESILSTTFDFNFGAMPVSRTGTSITFGTLPVSGGGTGLSSITNYALLAGSGTSIAEITAGASGTILFGTNDFPSFRSLLPVDIENALGYEPVATVTASGSLSILGTASNPVVYLPLLESKSIPFSNGTTFAENNSNLNWDNNYLRLGIGVSQPTVALQAIAEIMTPEGLLGGSSSLARNVSETAIGAMTGGYFGNTNMVSGAQIVYNFGQYVENDNLAEDTQYALNYAIGGVNRLSASATVAGEYGAGYFNAGSNIGYIENFYGIKIITANNADTVNNRYQLFINDPITSVLTDDFAIYQEGSGTKNYFGSKVGIGTEDPTAMLDVHSATNPIIQANNVGAFSAGSGGGTMQVLASSNTAVTSGSRLGAFQFAGSSDGAGTTNIGSAITAHATEDWTGSTLGSDLIFRITSGGTTTKIDAMRISEKGYVGIGVTNPSAKLHVSGSVILNVGSPVSGHVLTATDSLGNASWLAPSGGSSQWTTSGTNIFYNTGYVGIGVSVPTYNLSVNETKNGETSIFVNNQSTGTSAYTALRFTPYLGSAGLHTYGSNYTGTNYFKPLSTTLWNNSGDMIVAATAAGPIGYGNLRFYSGGNNERMTVTSGGAIGINTITPLAALSVSGGVQVGIDSTSCSAAYAGTFRYASPNIEFCNGSLWTILESATTISNGSVTSSTITSSTVFAGIVSSTASATLLVNQNVRLISSQTAAITLTLPSVSATQGAAFEFKKIASSNNFLPIYITASGSVTIDGATSATMMTNGESLKVMSMGDQYVILDRYASTKPVVYTPTFTGFGTPTNVNFTWRREGKNLIITGTATCGTPTATEARISFPSSLIKASGISASALYLVGLLDITATNSNTYGVYAEPGVSYLTFGFRAGTSAGMTKRNADATFGSGQTFGFTAIIPINEWGG